MVLSLLFLTLSLLFDLRAGEERKRGGQLYLSGVCGVEALVERERIP